MRYSLIFCVVVFLGIFLSPILFVLGSIFAYNHETWHHLAQTVLWEYILNSIYLSIGVAVGTVVIGVSTAWLVSMCRFPSRSWWEWLLLMPLASPAYILAYVYTEFLAFYGPVQTHLRQWFGWQAMADYWFPNIRSLGGGILMLTLVLYPYVYLLARVAFLEQSVCTMEASRSLGANPWRSFWQVALPLARPSIVSGVTLALMETLNDYGTVQYFGIDTFTTGIFRTWFGLGERQTAMQLAAVLTLLVLWLILVEGWTRRQNRYYQDFRLHQSPVRYQLRGWRAWGAILVCALPVVLGFFLPLALLIEMVWEHKSIGRDFFLLSRNSFLLALVAALLGAVLGTVLAYIKRVGRERLVQYGLYLASMGYSIPGSVIAVGTLVPLGTVDQWLNDFCQNTIGTRPGLVLSGSLFALVFAYLVRFLAIPFNAISASLEKVKPNLDEAAQSLGSPQFANLWKIHTPLIQGSILTSSLILFVDVMKELPATIVMRPFNWETLAVRVYQYASDERLMEATAPALMILLVGLIPVLILSWQIKRTRPQN
ncbi:MAG: iron ABC transporter permease [Pseudanabaenaceae cyanobacterium SKYGB_i_bin29]|nr:iron ABC transporter permease [Pseudanabaenaceae cyanobacterium SKYG29]MDW8420723.1 iron ABC transporter permease [Pseudanabaenaceae cyanobacterium SKYGB_i_bin29]